MVWWISLGMENHSPGGQDEAGRGQWRSGLSSWLGRGPFLCGRRWDGLEGPSFQAPFSHSVLFLSRDLGALYRLPVHSSRFGFGGWLSQSSQGLRLRLEHVDAGEPISGPGAREACPASPIPPEGPGGPQLSPVMRTTRVC